MRLDLFLKASRLCPRRTLAQTLCDAGLVSLNNQTAKAARTVKPGDEITLRRRNRLTSVRVLALPSTRQTSKAAANNLYELLSEESVESE